MSLMRRDPDAFMPLREAMNHLFEDSFFWPGRLEVFPNQTFPIDIYESVDKQQYIVEVTVAGFKPEEIQITAENNTLTIHAARKEESKSEKGGYMRRERSIGEMSRTVMLPTGIDAEKVQATCEQGVLTLRLPKAAGAKPKQIPVRAREAAGVR